MSFYNFLFGKTSTSSSGYMDSSRKRELLSSWNKGLSINGAKSFSKMEEDFRHYWIQGNNGSGKTSVSVIANLLRARLNKSIVITDTGEAFEKTHHYLRKKGFYIQVIDFERPYDGLQFNPLSAIENDMQAQQLAKSIMEISYEGTKGSDPFWFNSAVSLLELLIRILTLSNQEQFEPNLESVYRMLHMLDVPSEQVKIHQLYHGFASEDDRLKYKAFVGGLTEKVRSSVLATAKSALSSLNSEAIRYITNTTTIDFASLRDKERPTALFLIMKENKIKYFSMFTSLLYQGIFDYLMEVPSHSDELPVYFLLDEFPAYKIPAMPSLIATLRRKRVCLCLYTQDIRQIQSTYGNDYLTILGNCNSKIIFPGSASKQTNQYIEDLLGHIEVKEDGNYKRVKPLLSSGELRKIKGKLLFIRGQEDPLLLPLKPYYKNWLLKKRTRPPRN